MPNSLVDEVLSRVDIVDVISRYIPLKRAGSNFSACCPFHGEKTPSFMVSPTKQIFKCFWCWKGWNVFSFVQEIEKIDFRDAVKLLAKDEHIDISQYETTSKYAQKSQDDKEKLKRMHKLAQEFFVESLHKNESALMYLHENRNLDDKLISDFWIGFATDKHYELLQHLRSKWFSDEDMLEASLAKRSQNGEVYAFFRNRITFPIYDLMQNVVGFSARIFNWEVDAPKYINSAEHKAFEKSKILFGLSRAKQFINTEKKLIVVEWQMDVIWLARLWVPVWVATSGTALTEQHIKILQRHTENLFLLFDNDQAGRQATFRALKLCYAQDLFPKIITLPEWFKDADELANHQNWNHLFQECIQKATDGFIEIFDRLRGSFDMSSPIDKTKLINTMFELILSVNNVLIQESYKKAFAEKLWFPFETVDVQFKKYVQWAWKIFVQQQRRQSEEKKSHYQPDREQLFASIFYNDFLSSEIRDNSEFNQDLESFSKFIARVDGNSLLAHVLNNSCSEDEKKLVDELQLRREKEISELWNSKDKRAVILTTITPVIQELFKIATKSKNLTDDEKKQLIILKSKLWRR